MRLPLFSALSSELLEFALIKRHYFFGSGYPVYRRGLFLALGAAVAALLLLVTDLGKALVYVLGKRVGTA